MAEPVPDGRLDEPDWRQAAWVTLDGSCPARPRDEAKWRELEIMVGKDVRTQFENRIRAAVLWTPNGLYFGFSVDDADIIGRMKDGEWLWLEDVVELFLAPAARPGEKYIEIQLSPANAVFINAPPGVSFGRPATGVRFDGVLNDSRQKDRR